jgi:hypothetical protein
MYTHSDYLASIASYQHTGGLERNGIQVMLKELVIVDPQSGKMPTVARHELHLY